MAGDPYWASVVLAMHMDGANASTVFTDLKGHAVTAVGDAKISTAQSKFGGASALFDGTGDYLTLPTSADWNFGTGDFTIEAWLYPANITGLKAIFGGAAGEMMFNLNAGTLQLGSWYVAGLIDAAGVAANTWTHVAITRSGKSLMAFVGGVLASTVWNESNFSFAAAPRIGSSTYATDYAYFNGYIEDLRITKGVARYVATFTPPVIAFPNAMPIISGTVKDSANAFAPRAVRAYRKSDGALSGAVTSHATTGAFSIPALDASAHYALVHDSDADPYWSSVVLATHFDTDSVIDPYMSSVVLGLHTEGVNASTVFQDVTGKTITANGNAQISTAQAKFGASSLRLDGVYTTNGEHLTIPKTSDFDFGSGNFTIEGWLWLDSATAGGVLFSTAANVASLKRSTRLYINTSGCVGFIASTDGTAVSVNIAGSTVMSSNTWYHVCAVRSGTTVSIYLNGVLQASATLSGAVYYTTDEPVCIGVTPESATSASASTRAYLAGYIDDLRITKGVARYTANFTPPAVPFSSFKDLKGNDLMVNGGPAINTTTKKYGDGSLYFDGTGDACTVPYNSGFDFGGGDFTVELWVNPSTTAAKLLLSRRTTSGSVTSFLLFTSASNQPCALLTVDGTTWLPQITGVSIATVAAWTHIALVRCGSVITLFVNGVAEGIRLGTSLAISSTPVALSIGADLTITSSFNGYIDDIRITKGVARYQADFTPPERAFAGAMTAGVNNALIYDDLTPV